jgi:hypothetical protein
MAQLNPRALRSLFVASYDSPGLLWRYSNPPPHGSLKTKVSRKLYITFSSYLTGNLFRLRYRANPVNAVKEIVAVHLICFPYEMRNLPQA